MALPKKVLVLVRLEDQSDTELNYAPGQRNILELGESITRDAGIFHCDARQISSGVGSITWIRMIQEVDRRGLQLQSRALPNLDVLENAQVELVDGRAAQIVAGHVAKRSTENLRRPRTVNNQSYIVWRDCHPLTSLVEGSKIVDSGRRVSWLRHRRTRHQKVSQVGIDCGDSNLPGIGIRATYERSVPYGDVRLCGSKDATVGIFEWRVGITARDYLDAVELPAAQKVTNKSMLLLHERNVIDKAQRKGMRPVQV